MIIRPLQNLFLMVIAVSLFAVGFSCTEKVVSVTTEKEDPPEVLRTPDGPVSEDIIEDVDGDGIKNPDDNCPKAYNVEQEDFDKDGIGNVCDANDDRIDKDLDKDGVLNDKDNCPNRYNPQQGDVDHNGIGDFCDILKGIKHLAGRYDIWGTSPGYDSVTVAEVLGLGSIDDIPPLYELPPEAGLASTDKIGTMVPDSTGKKIYFCGQEIPTIRSWDRENGTVANLVGNPRYIGKLVEGIGLNAYIINVGDMVFTPDEKYLILPQRAYNCLLSVELESREMKIAAGVCDMYEGNGEKDLDKLNDTSNYQTLKDNIMLLDYPGAVVYDKNGLLFVADYHNAKIRWIYADPKKPADFLKSGPATNFSATYIVPDDFTYEEDGVTYHRMYVNAKSSIGYFDYSYHPECLYPAGKECNDNIAINPDKKVVRVKDGYKQIVSKYNTCHVNGDSSTVIHLYNLTVGDVNGVKNVIFNCLITGPKGVAYNAGDMMTANGIYSIEVRSDSSPETNPVLKEIYFRSCNTNQPIPKGDVKGAYDEYDRCRNVVFDRIDGPLTEAYTEAAPILRLVGDDILLVGESLNYSQVEHRGGLIREIDLGRPEGERTIVTKMGLPGLNPAGWEDGDEFEGRFYNVRDIVIDEYDPLTGRVTFYAIDQGNNTIRKGEIEDVRLDDPKVAVSTIAGIPHNWNLAYEKEKYMRTQAYRGGDYNMMDNDGYVYEAEDARQIHLYVPINLALSPEGRKLYISSITGVIQELDLVTGRIGVVAGKLKELPGKDGKSPWSAIKNYDDPMGYTNGMEFYRSSDGEDHLVMSTYWENKIYVLNLTKKQVERSFGTEDVFGYDDDDEDSFDGNSKALLAYPAGLSIVDVGGKKYMYVGSKYEGNVIRFIDLDRGFVTTLTGNRDLPGYFDGPIEKALWSGPHAVSAVMMADDAKKGTAGLGDVTLFVIDILNSRVRQITGGNTFTNVGSTDIGMHDGVRDKGLLGYSLYSIACRPGFCLLADTDAIRIIK